MASHESHQHGSCCQHGKHKQGAHSHQAAPAPGTVKDPVCGMTVDPHTAKHRYEHGGKTYYFCAARCREKFAADPAAYLDPAQAAAK